MNPHRHLVILIGTILVALMGLFPPWRFQRLATAYVPVEQPAGYSLVFRPPPQPDEHTGVSIDTPRLAVEWITTILLCSGLVILLRRE
jgi:hypothetical protein